MRIRTIIPFILICAALTARADETLPFLKVGPDTYTRVTVTAVSATDIYFTSDQGIANAKLKNLDPALQRHFKYDAVKGAAVEKQQKAAGPFNPAVIDRTNAQSVMDEAVTRVKAIVNQPVRRFRQTDDMQVSVFSPGWFHPGASKPDFDTVDVRATQEFPYKEPYASSDVTPGVVFIGPELEFNSMTKYFYTDRSLPKARLSQAEMLEINRLYRIIGKCEALLNAPEDAQTAPATQTAPDAPDAPADAPKPFTLDYFRLHKILIVKVSTVALVVLLILRFLTGRRTE